MRRYWSALYLVVAVVLIVVIGLLGGLPLPIRWLLIMGVFVALLVIIGRDVTGVESDAVRRRGRGARFVPGRWDGILIDLRHKVSLSRLQLVLWTVVVLSAWITLALHRTIPVLQGQLLGSEAGLVDEVAGLLAGESGVTAAHTERATAILEQLTGGDMTPADGEAPPAYAPLDIAIPPEVLAALGISIASMAGASVIKTNQASNEDGRANEIVGAQMEKATVVVADASRQANALESMRQSTLESLNQPALEAMPGEEPPPVDPEALQAAQAQLATLEAQLRAAETAAARAEERATRLQETQALAVGELHTRPTAADARWNDMLRGDTIANYQYADLGKIQMFFFTIVLVFSYAALLWSIMSMPMAESILQIAPTLRLPGFSESLVLILGISHGGYLVTKNAA